MLFRMLPVFLPACLLLHTLFRMLPVFLPGLSAAPRCSACCWFLFRLVCCSARCSACCRFLRWFVCCSTLFTCCTDFCFLPSFSIRKDLIMPFLLPRYWFVYYLCLQVIISKVLNNKKYALFYYIGIKGDRGCYCSPVAP